MTWAEQQIDPDDMHAPPHPFDTIDTSVFVGAEVTPRPTPDAGETESRNIMTKEPALILGAVGAIISLAVAFGLNLTPEQVGGIMAAVTAVLALVVRSQVTPAAAVVVKSVDGGFVSGPAAPGILAGKPVAVTPVAT